MSDYWIKWYHDILDDPKMATLPDRLWRRFGELCLLAGRLGGKEKTGILPDTRQIAWLLRLSTDDLQLDLDQLAATGMIAAVPNGWVILNFQKRQRAASPTERWRAHRDRKQKEDDDPNENQTKSLTEEKRRESEREENPPRVSASPEIDLYHDSPEIDLYHEVTGLYPSVVEEPVIVANIASLRKKLKYPPVEKVKAVMLEKFSLWKSGRTADGRPYNPSNPAWLEWCITGHTPEPPKPKVDPKTQEMIAARQRLSRGP